MTLTIDVPRDVELALAERAQNKGQSVPQYVTALLSEVACVPPKADFAEGQADVTARLAALAEISAHGTRVGLPPLSDEAVAQLYSEREDTQL
jgi:hypothetical protein